jgi:hypothetical protein
VRGVAEEDFVCVQVDPFGAQTSGNVAAEMPSFENGETIVSPRPAPTGMSTSVAAAAATPPATTGPRLVALAEDSSGTTSGTTTPTSETAFAIAFLLVPEQQDQDDDRDWHSEKPKQDSATYRTLLSADIPKPFSRHSQDDDR